MQCNLKQDITFVKPGKFKKYINMFGTSLTATNKIKKKEKGIIFQIAQLLLLILAQFKRPVGQKDEVQTRQ